MEDALIIKYIKKKNEKGLELLLKNYGGLIKSIIQNHLKDMSFYNDECMDDILLSVWNNINSFDGSGSFKSWIGVVSKFKAIDYKRKYFKLNSIEDIDSLNIADKSDFTDDIIYEEFKEEVNSLLDNLKKTDKSIFVKYYLEDKKIEEVAVEMDMDKGKIYNRLSRGRKKLGSILKEIY